MTKIRQSLDCLIFIMGIPMLGYYYYHQTSNISHTLVGIKIVDPSDVVGSIACRRCSNYIFILDLTPGFNALGKDNCQMRRETFKIWDLVQLILEDWRYIETCPYALTWVPVAMAVARHAASSQGTTCVAVQEAEPLAVARKATYVENHWSGNVSAAEKNKYFLL